MVLMVLMHNIIIDSFSHRFYHIRVALWFWFQYLVGEINVSIELSYHDQENDSSPLSLVGKSFFSL